MGLRSARTLGYNPAEMEWVRDRMAEVSGYLVAKPMQAQAATLAEAKVVAPETQALSLGFTGVTRTPLRPSGKAVFGEKVLTSFE